MVLPNIPHWQSGRQSWHARKRLKPITVRINTRRGRSSGSTCVIMCVMCVTSHMPVADDMDSCLAFQSENAHLKHLQYAALEYMTLKKLFEYIREKCELYRHSQASALRWLHWRITILSSGAYFSRMYWSKIPIFSDPSAPDLVAWNPCLIP